MQDTDRLRELADRLINEPSMTYETPILNERQKTHGSYESNARLSQRFRAFMRAEPGWDKLSDVQRQSLDEISIKIGRILSGDPNFGEHWKDISGYALLCEERCSNEN